MRILCFKLSETSLIAEKNKAYEKVVHNLKRTTGFYLVFHKYGQDDVNSAKLSFVKQQNLSKTESNY